MPSLLASTATVAEQSATMGLPSVPKASEERGTVGEASNPIGTGTAAVVHC